MTDHGVIFEGTVRNIWHGEHVGEGELARRDPYSLKIMPLNEAQMLSRTSRTLEEAGMLLEMRSLNKGLRTIGIGRQSTLTSNAIFTISPYSNAVLHMQC